MFVLITDLLRWPSMGCFSYFSFSQRFRDTYQNLMILSTMNSVVCNDSLRKRFQDAFQNLMFVVFSIDCIVPVQGVSIGRWFRVLLNTSVVIR